jgi:hypothetical protein
VGVAVGEPGVFVRVGVALAVDLDRVRIGPVAVGLGVVHAVINNEKLARKIRIRARRFK